MFFNETKILTSNLSKEELLVKLKKIVKTDGSYPSDKYLFRGKVNKVGFDIKSIPYSLDNKMVILNIVGNFNETPKNQIGIDLKVTLAIELKFVLLLGVLFNLVIIASLYFNLIDEHLFFNWKFNAILLIFCFPIYYLFLFRLKSKSIDKLKIAMNAN